MNTALSKRPLGCAVLLLITGWLCAISAHAVTLSSNSAGEVLLFPFFTADAGHDTLLKLNLDSNTGAVGVVVRNPQGGIDTKFNIYQPGGAVWAAAITRQGDATVIRANQQACMIQGSDPEDPEAPLVQVQDVELGTSSGSIEVYLMGRNLDLEFEIFDRDCDAILNKWQTVWDDTPNAGMNPPDLGTLHGTANIINVQRGDMYDYAAFALEDFSDVVYHIDPRDPDLPNLTLANNADRSDEFVFSTRCEPDNNCVEHRWSSGIDAVSAALMTDQAVADYNISPNLEAKTDWIAYFPTIQWYEDQFDELNPVLSQAMHTTAGLNPRGRDGIGYNSGSLCITGLPCTLEGYPVPLRSSIEVIAFNDPVISEGAFELGPSGILEFEHIIAFPTEDLPTPPEAGTAEMELSPSGPFQPFLTSLDDDELFGRPMLGLALIQYVNGTLVGDDGERVISTYGATEVLKRR